MTDSMDLALKIMALVDENPSEPFSFERKQMELKLEEVIASHTQQIDDELQESFDLGLYEGKRQAEDDLGAEIHELEEKIEELEAEIEDLKNQAETDFVQGYETGYRQA